MPTEAAAIPPEPPEGAVVAEPDVVAEASDEEVFVEALDIETSGRLWVKTITLFLERVTSPHGAYRPITSLPSSEDMNPRVRFAIDQATVAACERIGRIMRSDLPSEESP